ncbi:MAG: sulfate/molybdate ABC transporter ATP-binding protein [Lachnospiraceae bacterium]|nr:sulfate/molybdate ABC transporter ATP-binding protein [Candidatus Equihabitans merdae]
MAIYVDIKKKMGDFELKVKFEAGHETLALLGDSGCGKSMTLRCIAGIMTPDEGVIRINDHLVFDSEKKINIRPQDRHVGFLFQNYALFPNMTVLENIMVGLERQGKQSKAYRAEEAGKYVEALHLSGLEDHYPSQLSGGQQQRTALARILASKPEILLLDEPFSALDAALRWEMEQVVRNTIKEFDGSTLLVSHNRDEVYRLSDKVAVYLNGHIDAFDEKWKLFADPHTAAAARLTGCKNISKAHVEGRKIVADEWGIAFDLPREGFWQAIGLRAHDFRLCQEGAPYSFAYEVTDRIEDTFSYIISIRPQGVVDSPVIRWELDKAEGVKVPDQGFCCVSKEKVMLLTQ